MTFWEKVVELLRESVIVQAMITLCVVATACYLVATSREVPEWLLQAMFAVLGFYFGSKAVLRRL